MPQLTSETIQVLIDKVNQAAKRGGPLATVRLLYGVARALVKVQSDVTALEAELVRLRNQNRKLRRQKRQWMTWVGLAAKDVPLPDDTEYQE